MDQELNSRIRSGGGPWNARRRPSSSSLSSLNKGVVADGQSPAKKLKFLQGFKWVEARCV